MDSQWLENIHFPKPYTKYNYKWDIKTHIYLHNNQRDGNTNKQRNKQKNKVSNAGTSDNESYILAAEQKKHPF